MTNAAVGVYRNGEWFITVTFKRKWQARLFHFLLNQTDEWAGVRDY